MRTRPAITILASVLLTIGASSPIRASTRKTGSDTTSPKSKTKSSSSAKKSSTAKKHASSNRRSARMHLPTAPTPARISEIQSALADQGAYQGAPNGKWDAATIDAMQRFQQAHGLNPTGKLDAPSLEKLGLGAGTAGIAAPLPQPEASAGSLPATSAQSQNP